MKYLSGFLSMVLFGGALSRTIQYQPSERLPKGLVRTKCGFMSSNSVDDLRKNFSSFRDSVDYATENFNTLRIPGMTPNISAPTAHSNLDPYNTAMNDNDCWLGFNESVRIYLDAKILKRFVDPLINISMTEFKKGLSQGGNFTNMGLAIATIIDRLIKGISRLDCVIEATNISVKNPEAIKSPPRQPRPEPTTDVELMQMMWLQLRDTKFAVERTHRDLQTMTGQRMYKWGGPDKCSKSV